MKISAVVEINIKTTQNADSGLTEVHEKNGCTDT